MKEEKTVIQFKCDSDFKRYAQEKADKKGLTLSAYIINLILRDLIENKEEK